MSQVVEAVGILKKTPLYDRHLALQGKMIPFGGFLMPVHYSVGIIQEHRWVRQSCGVFDVSHLGEIRVRGKGAGVFLQYRLTQDLNKIRDGQMQYTLLCDEKGRTLDDIVLYRAGEEDYFLVVNAGNAAQDLEALQKYAPDSVELADQSGGASCVAVQGPKSEEVLRRLLGFQLGDLGYYEFREQKFSGQPVWISRSGYTGEDGFEVFTSNALIGPLWDRLVHDGKPEGVLPVGLGARNTLRLEAGNVLYGHELDESTTPLEAGLSWAVSFEKGGFIGRDALLLQKQSGPSRKLVGFRVLDRAVARERYPVFQGNRKIGFVTSGSFAPSLQASIGMAYVEKRFAAPGTRIEIEVHEKQVPAEVVQRPFVPLHHKPAAG